VSPDNVELLSVTPFALSAAASTAIARRRATLLSAAESERVLPTLATDVLALDVTHAIVYGLAPRLKNAKGLR
jgi:hypothetical protein